MQKTKQQGNQQNKKQKQTEEPNGILKRGNTDDILKFVASLVIRETYTAPPCHHLLSFVSVKQQMVASMGDEPFRTAGRGAN